MSDARKAPAFGNAGNDSMQIHSHHDPERLRDELADFLDTMTEETFDQARLDEILAALDEVDPITDLPDTEERLAELHRKHAHQFEVLARETAETPESSPLKKPDRDKRKFIRLLPLVAVLVVLITVSANAFGFRDIFDLFTRWTSDIFMGGGEEAPHATITLHPLEEGEEAEYDSLQEALDAFGIKEQLAPTWIPERFELESVVAENVFGNVNIFADYIDKGEYLMIRYREITSDTTGAEQKGAKVTVVSYGGLKHYLMPNSDQYRVSWQNGELNCSINGTVSKEEITDIITSIYEGE